MLRAELAEVVERGYARTAEELEDGLNALGVVVRGHDGAVIGAIGVSGPAYRMPRESLPEIAEDVMEAARDLSRRMGHPG